MGALAGGSGGVVKLAVRQRDLGCPVLLANELANALVVEEYRNSARTNEDSDAVTCSEGSWIVNLKTIAADQFHRKRPKWLALLQEFQSSSKILQGHSSIV